MNPVRKSTVAVSSHHLLSPADVPALGGAQSKAHGMRVSKPVSSTELPC